MRAPDGDLEEQSWSTIKGGGGEFRATRPARRRRHEGYQMLVRNSGTFESIQASTSRPPYRPLVDFKQITNILSGPMVIAGPSRFHGKHGPI